MSEKKTDIVVNVDDELLDEMPYEDKYAITETNKVEMIKYFEKLIRGSFEYAWFIDLLKKTLDVKSCVFFKEYSLENGMKLEFHHHPFTLFDYTEAVVNKILDERGDDQVYEMDVAREVAMLHYKFCVGLVPLDPTSHAQVHDGVLDIHPSLVIGNYNRFFEEYNNYISDSAKMKYTEWLTSHANKDLQVPKNYKYLPTTINASNKQMLSIEGVDRLLLTDKLQKINNEDIAKLLQGE